MSKAEHFNAVAELGLLMAKWGSFVSRAEERNGCKQNRQERHHLLGAEIYRGEVMSAAEQGYSSLNAAF